MMQMLCKEIDEATQVVRELLPEPSERRPIDTFPDARIASAINTLRALRENESGDPLAPWTSFAPDPGNEATRDILALWVAGLVSMAAIFDRDTGKAQVMLARTK